MPEFTIDKANRALPLVRRIVEDLVRGYARWREKVQEFELATAMRRADQLDPEADRLQRDVMALAEEVHGFMAELEQLGVELKEPQTGLVDFPARIDGRPAYLCWRLGEPAVEFWHDRDAGFAGRKPLSDSPHAAA